MMLAISAWLLQEIRANLKYFLSKNVTVSGF